MSNKIVKIEVDKAACIGAATCNILAPDAFVLDTDGIASVKSTFANHTDEELISAARSCPTQAIKLIDAQGNTVL